MDKISAKQKPIITIMLGISSLLCIVLVMLRIYLTLNLHFSFLVWNLLLAWIPFLLSGSLTKMDQQHESNWKLGSLFILWLLFFPNASYIITDLFHLKQAPHFPLWYDLVLIISFAWTGLMLGFVSLFQVHQFLTKKFTKTNSWLMVIAALLLCGFGVYLGRYGRWNSWDIILHPITLIADITDRFINPLLHPRAIGVTLLFSTFLIISYVTLFYLIKYKPNQR